MNRLVAAVLVLFGLVEVLVAVGGMLPTSFEGRAEGLVEAPPQRVRQGLVARESLLRWSGPAPGLTVDPPSGPDEGVGLTVVYRDERQGQVIWTLSRAEPLRIETAAMYVDTAMFSRGEITLTPEGTGTRVVWIQRADAHLDPFSAWLALFFGDAGAQAGAEQSLARLEAWAEGP